MLEGWIFNKCWKSWKSLLDQICNYNSSTILSFLFQRPKSGGKGNHRNTKTIYIGTEITRKENGLGEMVNNMQTKRTKRTSTKDIKNFNVTLLAKWKWMFATKSTRLWRNILQFKYVDWRELNQFKQSKHESVWWKYLKLVCGI